MSCLSEVWKDIPGYEGLYQASSLGRIRSLPRPGTKASSIRVLKQCHVRPPSKKKRTDYCLNLSKNGKEIRWFVSRLVGMTFLGIPDKGMTINHIDGNPFNNAVSNLEWVTREKNIQLRFDTGLYSSKCLACEVINKKTGQATIYRSCNMASKTIGRFSSYILTKIRRGHFEDRDYSWRLV